MHLSRLWTDTQVQTKFTLEKDLSCAVITNRKIRVYLPSLRTDTQVLSLRTDTQVTEKFKLGTQSNLEAAKNSEVATYTSESVKPDTQGYKS